MKAMQESWNWMYEKIFTWRWFVRLVRWIIISGGTVAESAFLVATLYVTICVVAHPLLTWMFDDHTIAVLNQVSVIVFACIPELIVFSAVKVTIDHWKTAISTRNKWSFVWAIAYSIPTLVFLIMTIITITSFVSLQEIDASQYQVNGANLITRVLFGWFYGVVGMLFDTVGKAGYAETITHLNNEVADREDTITVLQQEMTQLQEDRAMLQEQIAQQERALFDAQMVLATRRMTRSPLTVAKSPVGITSMRPRNQPSAKSGLDTEQSLDSGVQSSGLDTEQSLDSGVQSSGLDTRQPLDSSIQSTAHKTRQLSPLLQDSHVQSSGLKSEQSVDSGVQSTVQSSDLESEQEGDSTVLSSVSKTRRVSPQSSNKTVSSTAHTSKQDSSEAAKKIQRILRRNPNTGPTELAAKTGVSKSYASLIKSQFLTALSAEQLA